MPVFPRRRLELLALIALTAAFLLCAARSIGIDRHDETLYLASAPYTTLTSFYTHQSWAPLYSVWYGALAWVVPDPLTRYFASWALLVSFLALLTALLKLPGAWIYTLPLGADDAEAAGCTDARSRPVHRRSRPADYRVASLVDRGGRPPGGALPNLPGRAEPASGRAGWVQRARLPQRAAPAPARRACPSAPRLPQRAAPAPARTPAPARRACPSAPRLPQRAAPDAVHTNDAVSSRLILDP